MRLLSEDGCESLRKAVQKIVLQNVKS